MPTLGGTTSPAASSELRPTATRRPLKPTAATQRLSAAARASDPQAKSNRVVREYGFSESDEFTFPYSLVPADEWRLNTTTITTGFQIGGARQRRIS